MLKETFGVWSPHRDSNSVLAFKSLLSLRSERWVWHPEPQFASWWIVDGTRESLDALTTALHKEKASATVRGALLAPAWSAVKDPVWTFFRVPLQINQVYRWIESSQPLQTAPVASFAGQRLKLRRWPNMSRYTTDSGLAQSMQLTVACARLLKEPVDYTEAQTLVPDIAMFDTLLRDALNDGILELTRAEESSVPPPMPATASAVAADRPDDRGAWSLVKRLIRKFT